MFFRDVGIHVQGVTSQKATKPSSIPLIILIKLLQLSAGFRSAVLTGFSRLSSSDNDNSGIVTSSFQIFTHSAIMNTFPCHSTLYKFCIWNSIVK